MKYMYLVLNWIFGLFFLLTGIAGILFDSVLLGIPFVLISLLLLPPVRNFVYSKTKKEMSVVVRTILIFVFLGVFGVFNQQNMEKDYAQNLATEQAKQKNEQHRQERKQQKIVYFNANREQIILDIKASLTAKEYQSVLSQSAKYFVLDDKELNELNAIAKKGLAETKKAKQAELAEKKRLAKIERVKQAEIRQAELAEKKRLAEIERVKQAEIRQAELAEKKRLAEIERVKQAEVRKAELAEEKRLAEAKTKQLLLELKTIPVREYEKNKNLYQQLVKINSDNKKYRDKLSFYSRKIREADKKQKTILSVKAAKLKLSMSKKEVINLLGEATWAKIPKDKGEFQSDALPLYIKLKLMWKNTPCIPVEVSFDNYYKVKGWSEGRGLCYREHKVLKILEPGKEYSCKKKDRRKLCS
jgi:hypothetical protein